MKMKAKMKFLIYGGLLLGSLFLGIFFGTGNDFSGIKLFISTPSLIYIFVSVLLIMLGGAGFRTASNSFYDAFDEKTVASKLPRYKQAQAFFRMMDKSCLYMGSLAVLAGLVTLLMKIHDKSAIGPAAAFALLGLMYALLLRAFLFQPLTLVIEKKILSIQGGSDV